MSNVSDLKAFAAHKFVLGAKDTLKHLRSKKLCSVFVSSNCDSAVKADIERYCRIGSVEFSELDETSEDIGVVCKKSFFVSVVGIVS